MMFVLCAWVLAGWLVLCWYWHAAATAVYCAACVAAAWSGIQRENDGAYSPQRPRVNFLRLLECCQVRSCSQEPWDGITSSSCHRLCCHIDTQFIAFLALNQSQDCRYNYALVISFVRFLGNLNICFCCAQTDSRKRQWCTFMG